MTTAAQTPLEAAQAQAMASIPGGMGALQEEIRRFDLAHRNDRRDRRVALLVQTAAAFQVARPERSDAFAMALQLVEMAEAASPLPATTVHLGPILPDGPRRPITAAGAA